MSDAIPSRPPLSPAEGWNPPSRDFFGGPPPVDMTSPANVPPVQSEHEFLYGDVPPEVVFKPLLERLGPGAASMVEREMDRARAFEVIARAAIEFIDNGGSDIWCERGQALREAVAENRAAI